MPPLDQNRTFIPVERKDGSWSVKAEHPDAVTQDIGDFKSEAEAQDWIIQESASYFRKRSSQSA
jgi:hypothetical protein